jgi:hypothetical protein
MEASDGRRLLNGLADGLGERAGVLLPVQDGVLADAERVSGLIGGAAEERLDFSLAGVREGSRQRRDQPRI